MPQLGAQLRLDPLQIEPVLDRLAALDWVARLDEEDAGQRFVLLCEPASTPIQPLIEALLLAPSPSGVGFHQAVGWERMSLAQALPPVEAQAAANATA